MPFINLIYVIYKNWIQGARLPGLNTVLSGAALVPGPRGGHMAVRTAAIE